MSEDDLLQRFWDATLADEPVDYEAFLAEGNEEVADAVRVHQLFLSAAKSWNQKAAPYKLGRFQVLGELGAGGMGRVYLGWDPDLHRRVAIKVIARDRWAVNEARAIASLDHRSIVRVYEVGRDRIVMELLEGGSLQEKLAEIRAGGSSFLAPLRARLHCLVQLAEGLSYCHERGILHRDIKPGNVLFAKDDQHPRLVDFGLAHQDELESLAITQNLVGTPAYLAPEQIESGETGVDRRSDIFSFGVMAYELLTLDSPFVRETRTATLEAVSAAHPRRAHLINAEIPRGVTNILEHCLEPVPWRRYGSMQEVARDLQNALANRPISVGSRSLVHRTRLYLQRNRLAAGFATVGGALAMVLVAGLWLASVSVERTTFAQRVEGLLARVPEIHTSAAFHEVGLDLFSAQSRARELNDFWIGKELFRDCEALVIVACEKWSRHLRVEIEALQSLESGVHPPDNWRPLVDLDARLLPAAEWNQDLRDRGAVLLQGELEARKAELVTYRQVHTAQGRLAPIVTWQLASLVKFPQIGFYRVEIPGAWQTEFLVESPWGEPVVLQLPKRRLDTNEWIDWEADGLLVSQLVTNREFEVYCEELGTAIDLIGHPTQAAMVSNKQAMGYAAWAGGRLPMSRELAALCESGSLEAKSSLDAEFVSDIPPLGATTSCSYFGYASWKRSPAGGPLAWLRILTRTSVRNGAPQPGTQSTGLTCGFRIIYLPQ